MRSGSASSVKRTIVRASGWVSGAVPGDVAEIKIIKVGSSYSVGRVERYITLSDKRVEGRCNNSLCRSCAYKCLSYEYEKELIDFCAARNVTFLTISSDDPIEKVIFGKGFEAEVIK